MKLFSFYIDSYEKQSRCYYNLIFPFCRNNLGYGIFYFGIDNMGFIKSIDSMGKDIHAYFENNVDSVNHYDNNMGRHGKNKLQEVNDSTYIRATIVQIFSSENMLQAIKMWSKI